MKSSINTQMNKLIKRFCEKNEIYLLPNSEASKIFGKSVLQGATIFKNGAVVNMYGSRCIFYDDSRDENIIRHILLHEIGHIFTLDWDDEEAEKVPVGQMPHSEFTADIFATVAAALLFMDEIRGLKN